MPIRTEGGLSSDDGLIYPRWEKLLCVIIMRLGASVPLVVWRQRSVKGMLGDCR